MKELNRQTKLHSVIARQTKFAVAATQRAAKPFALGELAKLTQMGSKASMPLYNP